MKVATDHRRTERSSRVHRPAGKRSGRQDVCSHDETDGDRRNCAQRSLLWVCRRRIDSVNQTEGRYNLRHNPFRRSYAGGNAVDRNRL